MKILALDTSGPVASVALAEDERLIGGFRLQSGYTHSQTLMPMLEEMFQLAGVDRETIDYIAVASGPGSFTGLRIGASAAKGLALALDKPVIAVPTLEAMACNLAGVSGIICPMMDARRAQIYRAAYRFVPEIPSAGREVTWKMRTVVPPDAGDVSDFLKMLNDAAATLFGDIPVMDINFSVFLTGDGVPVFLEQAKDQIRMPYTVVPFHRDRQNAEALCARAFQYAREGRVTDADTFTPEYYRPSQAEREKEKE